MSIAGHVSPKMLAHYSHVRLEAKRRALDGIASKSGKTVLSPEEGGEASYGTNNVTNALPEPEADSQVVENLVDLGRLELPTPWLQTRCSPS
jgi:hypothetical protein